MADLEVRSEKVLAIRGARTHNLKSIDLDIPHESLTVFTGVSGSGKSSLAFDTLYAEGERQYVDSLSAYARQFVESIPRPDLDSIDGLQPTLCIEQHRSTANPRSTLATVAEIYDYLRLLMARVGVPHCYACGRPIVQQSSDEIVSSLTNLPHGSRLIIMAPIVRGKKGSHRDLLTKLSQSGLLRARVDGDIAEIESLQALDPKKAHTIEAICDRLIVKDAISERLMAAVQLGLKLADGVLCVSHSGPSENGSELAWQDQIFSTHYACSACGISLAELEPRIFSFHSPYGACPECGGVGRIPATDSATTGPSRWDDGQPCPGCQGRRLRAESLAVRLNGFSISDITSLSLEEAQTWFSQLELTDSQRLIADPILTELVSRIEFLRQVGVGYLTLDRAANTLSGGELQRVRLATSLGSGLIGVCYILDEPSIGLHACDTERLIGIIRRLRDQGNTVVVVEHDEALIRSADLLIDIGPGSGPDGGTILAAGTVAEVTRNLSSITGAYSR